MTPDERTAWLAERRDYLGATDISAILGLNPWRSPRMVYEEKMGLASEKPMTEAMRWGIALEGVIAERYAEDTGRDVILPMLKGYRLPDPLSFLGCNPDRFVGVDRLLEVKTAGQWAGKEFGEVGSDDVPQQYLIQCVWQAGIISELNKFCPSIEAVDLAVLIAGQDFRIYQIPAAPSLYADMKQKAIEWWKTYILADCPPPLTGLDCDSDLLKDDYPADDGGSIAATPEIEDVLTSLAQIRNRIKPLETEGQRLINVVKEFMGENAMLTTPLWEKPITWKSGIPKKCIDWESAFKANGRRITRIARFTSEKPSHRTFKVPF